MSDMNSNVRVFAKYATNDLKKIEGHVKGYASDLSPVIHRLWPSGRKLKGNVKRLVLLTLHLQLATQFNVVCMYVYICTHIYFRRK